MGMGMVIVYNLGPNTQKMVLFWLRMAGHQIEFDGLLPLFSFLPVYSCFIMTVFIPRLVPLEMSSGDSGHDQPKVPDSLWTSVIDLALGKNTQ